MFDTIKNAWKVMDVRKKLLFTFFIIMIYRLGSAIPVPFVDGAKLAASFADANTASSLLGYFNLLSGDAFSKATLFALNISPYITASIVMQLLAVAIPALEKMSKSGPEGQQKIQKITRIVTIVLSLVMAFGYYQTINAKHFLTASGWFPCIVIIASFTAGACLTMWLGERIDEKGIGNGISMILFAGIVARGPVLVSTAVEWLKMGFTENPLYILYVLLAIAFMGLVVIFVVHITDAERRLPVQYAKRQVGRRVYGGNNTFLPLKLNMTGVMPIIFAQAIVSIPATLAIIFPSWEKGVTRWFSAGSPFP
ncbi:MAG: preprotein translocase subunit SecY, partial [Clostridia bacterium]